MKNILLVALVLGACDTLPNGPGQEDPAAQAGAGDVAARSFALDSITSFDDLDGVSCFGDRGVMKISYSDSSEVGDGPFTMTMKCVPDHPVLTYSPSSLDFGWSLGTTKYVSVTSEGVGPVTLGGVNCIAGDCSAFTAVYNSCNGKTLDYKTGGCVVGVKFTAGCTNKNNYAYYRVSSNAPSGSKYFSAAGNSTCIQ